MSNDHDTVTVLLEHLEVPAVAADGRWIMKVEMTRDDVWFVRYQDGGHDEVPPHGTITVRR